MCQPSRCAIDRQTAAVLLLWIALLAGCGAVVGQTAPVAPAPPPAGDPQRGATLFAGEVAITGFVACRGCHATDPLAGDGIGPNLAGVATRAGARVPGVAAEEYLRRSIRIHDDYVVPGFEAGIARAVVGRDFGDILTDEQIADLVAYLLTFDQPATSAATPVTGVPPIATVNGTALPASSGDPANPSTTPTVVAPDVAASPVVATAQDSSPTNTVSSPRTATVAPSATRADVQVTGSATIAPTVQPTATSTPAEALSPEATPEATATPIPTTAPTPALATPEPPTPAPTSPPVPATSAPPANSGAIPADLAVFVPCMACHDQHPASVVKMPHVVFPPCISCHSGSPIRLGCPTCHSTHRVQAPHADDDPNIPCSSCHPDR